MVADRKETSIENDKIPAIEIDLSSGESRLFDKENVHISSNQRGVA
jgi:hypothetical protein